MSEISIYERALIRLRAFELLEGWGDKPSILGRFPDPWDLQRRQQEADLLADWAINDRVEGDFA